MEVSIYINAYHRGHLSKGKGTYGAVLEYILKNGDPYTIELFDKVQPATRNKAPLIACISALKRLTKSCNIKIYINSHYITETINQGWYLSWD